MPNTKLAWEAYDLAMKHRQHFDMNMWGYSLLREGINLAVLTSQECGTTACYAGWIGAIQGVTMDPDGWCSTDSGRRFHVEDYARRTLDIIHAEAEKLFYCMNVEYLATVITEIFGERPE